MISLLLLYAWLLKIVVKRFLNWLISLKMFKQTIRGENALSKFLY